MFSATIAGTIKRIIHDNGKDKEKAMLKVVIECRKAFVKDGDMPYTYPVVTVWGHDAAYTRDYAGQGHWITVYNAEHESYRGEDGDEEERVSYRAGRIEILPKKMAEAIAETIEDEDDDDRSSKKKKKKKGSDDKKKSGGKSRSERRGKSRDEDEDEDYDDDEDEDEEDDRKSKKSKKSTKSKSKPEKSKKSSSSSKKKKSRDEEDEDEDYDDDDYYDDEEDDYFDEDED